MGRGKSKKSGSSAITQKATPVQAPTSAQAVAVAKADMGNVPVNATVMTDREADNLRHQEDASYDANATAATKMYISNTNFDGQGHSMSQTMNYLLDNGVDFNSDSVDSVNKKYGLNLNKNAWATMQYTNATLQNSLHSLGKDTILQRGAHDNVLKNVFNISDYSRMSQSQLQNALVGKAFRNTSYMSTSYDVKRNPFLSSSSGVSGGREVVYNIKAGKNTQVIFGAKKQSEIVIGKDTNFIITGVRFSGKTATPRGGRSKPQIIIDIETI